MKSKPLYRVAGKTQSVKAWACDWRVSYSAAHGRLLTLCAHKQAEPVKP